MIIYFKDDKHLAGEINNLLQESSILHKNIYEDKLFKIFRDHPGIHIEPKIDIYSPKKGWGWTWSSIRYFSQLDEYSAYLPESNKIDKDALDEIRSEDVIAKRNEILEQINKAKDELEKLEKIVKN